jgi:hypothetical protein
MNRSRANLSYGDVPYDNSHNVGPWTEFLHNPGSSSWVHEMILNDTQQNTNVEYTQEHQRGNNAQTSEIGADALHVLVQACEIAEPHRYPASTRFLPGIDSRVSGPALECKYSHAVIPCQQVSPNLRSATRPERVLHSLSSPAISTSAGTCSPWKTAHQYTGHPFPHQMAQRDTRCLQADLKETNPLNSQNHLKSTGRTTDFPRIRHRLHPYSRAQISGQYQQLQLDHQNSASPYYSRISQRLLRQPQAQINERLTHPLSRLLPYDHLGSSARPLFQVPLHTAPETSKPKELGLYYIVTNPEPDYTQERYYGKIKRKSLQQLILEISDITKKVPIEELRIRLKTGYSDCTTTIPTDLDAWESVILYFDEVIRGSVKRGFRKPHFIIWIEPIYGRHSKSTQISLPEDS